MCVNKRNGGSTVYVFIQRNVCLDNYHQSDKQWMQLDVDTPE
jgi:hypothetical protein